MSPPRSRSQIDANHLAALHAGTVATATLVEGLALSFPLLAHAVRKDFGPAAAAVERAAEATVDVGIVQRMRAVGQAIGGAVVEPTQRRALFAALQSHPSDTVRGWSCFACQYVGASDHGVAPKSMAVAASLTAIRPWARDAHFGVREWAWMAARPHLSENFNQAFLRLAAWSTRPDPFERRFASEVLRPIGVWCPSLPELRKNPDLGLPVLNPLSADPQRYVQDSVANWLNDAARTQPDWVRATCRRWAKAHGTNPHAARIIQRALRRCGEG